MPALPLLRRGLLAAALASLPLLAHSTDVPLTQASIEDLNKAFAAGTLSAESLLKMYLQRIAAYDQAGPRLNAVITLNPKALETARALDAERKAGKVRGPLHGVPVVLKDNFDTADLPTSGGSFLLKNSLPPDDAFVVKKLRAAGAIILAKVNLSEFASGSPMSSLGGQSLNPHDLERTPSGSSGGTGVAIAADYAPLGLGTDTGGSIRGPSTSNGIVGLKPTHGLLSRDGIIPLALSFDTGGPMARSVYDVALALGTMTGIDPADPATQKSKSRLESDYTRYLKADALKGARIGVARDFMGADPEVDWIIEASLSAMKAAGATIIDVKYPKWLLDGKGEFYNVLRRPEFREQVTTYLGTLKPGFPRSHAELMAASEKLVSPRDGFVPNQGRWTLFKQEAKAPALDDPEVVAVREHALPLIRDTLQGLMAREKLDAIVYPTSPRRPARLNEEPGSGAGVTASATNIANLSGFPDLIVPAGFTSGGLPVGISFFGTAFSEPKLLALGYAFEQKTRAMRLPKSTPPLEGEVIHY
ncbi:amidase [Solimonas aquatica]|uniref:Amidase n=1 Tax=Solimonas aquatica TaxID=489703 RepID=A0A1H9AFR5_9GAMM|nr:amidase family protein [Solimonas aquatica]SEP75632.1 amidase [Solimonas aquatica]